VSNSGAYRFAPCPFCGSEILHVESWARSFDPPRPYHEWQHVDDDVNACWIRRNRKIVGSASDDPNEQEHAIRLWNRRG
jgi:hypothetical protein